MTNACPPHCVHLDKPITNLTINTEMINKNNESCLIAKGQLSNSGSCIVADQIEISLLATQHTGSDGTTKP